MRKLSLILTIILCCNSIIGAAAYENENMAVLGALGILPSRITKSNLSDAAINADLVYMASKLLSAEDLQPAKTDNSYSEYIDFLSGFGIIGIDENLDLEAPVTLDMASKVLLSVLNYKEVAQAKGANGFANLAMDLGLYAGVKFTTDATLTNEGLIRMVYNSLQAQVGDFVYAEVDGEYSIAQLSDARNSFLGKRLGISVYTGVIRQVNDISYSAKVEITGNVYKTNKVQLPKGSVVAFGVKSNIDIYRFENVPSKIWVNEDEEIIYIAPSRNAEIKYSYISAVNGDMNQENTYSIKYISEIILNNDDTKYKVSGSAKLRFNGEETLLPVALINNFAKLVLLDGEIIYIESWNLSEGGIIEKISDSEIIYTKGELQNVRIKDFDRYRKKLVFIDGKSERADRLRPNSVFCYYEKDDTIVIVVSEKIITEKLHAVGEDEITIGNISYLKGNVYYAVDGVRYSSNGDFYPLLNCLVDAYFDPSGKCAYVKLSSRESRYYPRFIGAVGGYQQDGLGTTKIEIWKLEPTVERLIFEIDRKVRFYDGLTLNAILLTSKDINGNGIYEFEVGSKGTITDVRKAKPYYGYEDATTSVSNFPNDIEYLPVNGRALFFQGARIVALYNSHNGFTAKEVAWNQLRNKPAGGAKMKFYGEEEESQVRLAVLCGSVENIYSKDDSFGVIISKRQAVDDEGQICYIVTIGDRNGTKDYQMGMDTAKDLPTNAFIIYRKDVLFGEDPIKISRVIDLTAKIDEWEIQGNFEVGIVKKVDDRRVYFADGSAIFMHPYFNFIMEVDDDNRKNRFTLVNTDQVGAGDELIYYYSGDIRGMFIKKDKNYRLGNCEM